jgi:hypothetical protein
VFADEEELEDEDLLEDDDPDEDEALLEDVVLGDDPLEEDDETLADDPLVAESDDDEDDAVLPAEDDEEGEASLEELLAERSAARRGTDEADDDDDILALASEPDLPLDVALPVKVIPVKDQEEFVCAKCHLVKKKVQLVDAARQLCRDCV